MRDVIEQVLGDSHAMFYHPAWPIRHLRPVQTLDGTIHLVNRAIDQMGTDISRWDHGMQDEAGRLVRVNWIYQRLDTEPIRKPILVHGPRDNLIVDCGDTRLMALDLWNQNACVAVITTCLRKQYQEFHGWQTVHDSQQLMLLLGFLPHAQVHVNPAPPGSDHAIDWLEIGDETTGHHLHDFNQRASMMQSWLDQQPEGFRFSRDWATSQIDWDRHMQDQISS